MTGTAGHRRALFLAALIGLSLTAAWQMRFIQDDAFISFIYAKSLVSGDGLQWFGTRVEGYTNFLWVLWIALGMKLGIDPVLWSYAGGLASFVSLIIALWRLSDLLFGRFDVTATASIMLVTNYSVLAYATGGLETMFFTALGAWSMYLASVIWIREDSGELRYAALSLLMALMVLTRPDGAIPALVAGVWATAVAIRRGRGARLLPILITPFAVLTGAWMAFRVGYYGRLFPNTFYAKVASDHDFNPNGFVYIGWFLHSYMIWPLILIGALSLVIRKDRGWVRLMPLMNLVALWWIYVILVGGDFMEFRFMVVTAPFIFLALAYMAVRAMPRRSMVSMITSVVILAVFSFQHAAKFRWQSVDGTFDSINELSTFYGVYPDGDWSRIGARLGSDLEGTGAVIATTGAGAIPYYSGLKSIDMWGLNDLVIPLEGVPVPASDRRPGHRRFATLGYLREKGVNLLIGEPRIVPDDYIPELVRKGEEHKLAEWLDWTLYPGKAHIGSPTFVTMPLGNSEALLMLYLTPSEEIDAAIRGRWSVATIREN